jgi:hypothetical protein
MKRIVSLLIALLWTFSPHPASAQDEVTALRAEVRMLRAELEALRELVLSSVAGADPAPSPEVQLLQAQVEEQAQTKVESNSRMPVRLFGTILSNSFSNSGEVNWLDVPNVVMPDAGGRAGSFSSTLRQSRFGAIIDGPDIGRFDTTGLLAVDFFAGVPGFRTGQTMGVPRLLYGFMRLDDGRTAFEIGQDLMPLAPRNPTSLASFSFPNLFHSGNLYLRVPQVRAEQRFGVGSESELHLELAAVAPISGENPTSTFTFVPPKLAGEASRHPGIQARAAWRRNSPVPNEPLVELGVSGHYGSENHVTGDSSSWVGATDFLARRGRWGMQGEAWIGDNIEMFGGSIGQVARSAGGFVELQWHATERLGFNGGLGTDKIVRVRRYAPGLGQNSSVFANTIYQFTPEFATSFEWRRMRTTPIDGPGRSSHHFNMAFAYSF